MDLQKNFNFLIILGVCVFLRECNGLPSNLTSMEKNQTHETCALGDGKVAKESSNLAPSIPVDSLMSLVDDDEGNPETESVPLDLTRVRRHSKYYGGYGGYGAYSGGYRRSYQTRKYGYRKKSYGRYYGRRSYGAYGGYGGGYYGRKSYGNYNYGGYGGYSGYRRYNSYNYNRRYYDTALDN